MKNEDIDKKIEEFKRYNLLGCIALKNIADVIGTLCLTLDEWCMLNQIADSAIKNLIEKEYLMPKGITKSDLRNMLPDGAIPESKISVWENNLMKKFSKVV